MRFGYLSIEDIQEIQIKTNENDITNLNMVLWVEIINHLCVYRFIGWNEDIRSPIGLEGEKDRDREGSEGSNQTVSQFLIKLN